MNISNFKKALPILNKNNIVPFVWGKQGIGKTQTVSQVAKERNLEFIHLHLATQEVGDLVGLLVHNADGTVKHARPEWFPTEGQGIVFLDELNRAHPDVIQAMFSFITSRTIHTHKLPEGWKIVAAGNYNSEEFTVTDTSDAAWMSRFCHIELQPSVEEFLVYAQSKQAETIADFIRENEELLEARTKNHRSPVTVTPDRRAWMEMVAPLEKEELDDVVRFELYSGIVGEVAAASFMAHRRASSKKLRLKDILESYSDVQEEVKLLARDPDKVRFDRLSQPINELIANLEADPTYLKKEYVPAIQAFLLDIPLELAAQFIKKLGSLEGVLNRTLILNDKKFVDELKKKAR